MSSLVTSRDPSADGKITRLGFDTRRSRPPASTIVASDFAMPEVLRHETNARLIRHGHRVSGSLRCTHGRFREAGTGGAPAAPGRAQGPRHRRRRARHRRDGRREPTGRARPAGRGGRPRALRRDPPPGDLPRRDRQLLAGREGAGPGGSAGPAEAPRRVTDPRVARVTRSALRSRKGMAAVALLIALLAGSAQPAEHSATAKQVSVARSGATVKIRK